MSSCFIQIRSSDLIIVEICRLADLRCSKSIEISLQKKIQWRKGNDDNYYYWITCRATARFKLAHSLAQFSPQLRQFFETENSYLARGISSLSSLVTREFGVPPKGSEINRVLRNAAITDRVWQYAAQLVTFRFSLAGYNGRDFNSAAAFTCGQSLVTNCAETFSSVPLGVSFRADVPFPRSYRDRDLRGKEGGGREGSRNKSRGAGGRRISICQSHALSHARG